VIQIDVHPTGENPTNTPYAFHAWFAYGPRPYISHGLRRTTFHWLSQSWNKPINPEEVLATKDRLTQPSSWVASFFLPCDNPRVGERCFSPMVTHLLYLMGPYHQYVIDTFNTSLRGPTHWSLIDTGGLQPWRCRLTTDHSPTFATSYLHFPPKGPARSPV
jgi:hypothetical protein